MSTIPSKFRVLMQRCLPGLLMNFHFSKVCCHTGSFGVILGLRFSNWSIFEVISVHLVGSQGRSKMTALNSSDPHFDIYLSIIQDKGYWLTLAFVGFFLALTIIIGNSLLLLVTYKDPQKTLRTPPCLLITSLSASDLLVQELRKGWQWFCGRLPVMFEKKKWV